LRTCLSTTTNLFTILRMIQRLKQDALVRSTVSLPFGVLGIVGLLGGCAPGKAYEGVSPPRLPSGRSAATSSSTPGPIPSPSASPSPGRKLADAHFHFVDFLQRSDGIQAALDAM